MKYLRHKLYGYLFSFFKVFTIKTNRISFIIDSGESFKGNLDYIKKEFERRGNFDFNFFYKDKLSFSSFKSLATSKYVFLNDNFFPLAFMNFKNETEVVQLWHAPGASKKFGGSVASDSDIEMLSKIGKNTDYLISSSKKIENYYSEAFQIDKEKIIPLGLPRIDYYFENHDLNRIKSDFCKKYGIDFDKKIILYAPTFRDEKKYNNVFDFLDLKKFNDVLGEEYVLALRLHPKIKDFYHVNSLIKILCGLRRSGKSVILQQIIEEIKLSGVKNDHIIYVNFESLDYSDITTAIELNNYIKSLIKDKKNYYVFLDEVQKVHEFEKAINSLRITNQFSIFITGSNSKMTFLELSTDLSGRYVSFRINPLSFKEVVQITNTKKENYFDLLLDIFEWGTLPQRFMFNNNNSKENYIRDVYDSILLKDVVDRLGITDITSFNKILQYVLETETREFSATNVLEYLEKNGNKVATDTLYKYLEALCSTFIVNRVYRYDINGKAVLKSLNKFYATDLGVKKIKTNSKEVNYSQAFENIIYNELIKKGYDVYRGKTREGEIDFIASKNKDIKYIQACYDLSTEETRSREFGAFNNINDNYPKYVISTNKEDYSQNGIKNINIFDFLMDDKF